MEESAITVVPFGEITAPGAVKIYEGREVVKTFTDQLFGSFRIYKTEKHRRGWWEEDPTKVQKLIDAFKGGHNIKNALIWAGISWRNWENFLIAYPGFREIKEACEASSTFGAMNTVQEGLKTKPEIAFKYIEKRGDFNFEPRKVDEEKALQPNIVPVQVNINTNDQERIKAEVRAAGDVLVSEGSTSSKVLGNGGVAAPVQG